MRLLLLFLYLGLIQNTDAQHMNREIWAYPNPNMEIEVNDYIYDHFEIGGGGHIFILVPGGHAKIRFAPVNYQRIKLMGEIRGEFVTAPIAGWHYSVQAGTSFNNDLGIYAGFGRSHYVARALNGNQSSKTNHIFQNTFDFGIRWETARRQYDLWANIPLYTNYLPVYTVGISFTFGGLWNFDDQKWFLPQRI